MNSMILTIGTQDMNEHELSRLRALCTPEEGGRQFLRILEPDSKEIPDLVFVMIHRSENSTRRMRTMPVIGLTTNEGAEERGVPEGFQDVLPWNSLNGSWIVHAVIRALEDFQSERLRREQESKWIIRERLASVGLLASSIAHEIGTPLGVIRGKAEFQLLKLQDDPPRARDLGVMIQQVDRIAGYVRSVVNLAHGSSESGLAEVELCSMMAEVRSLVDPTLHSSNIRVHVSGGAEWGPAIVQVQPEAFRQVLFELFSNSIHAIEAARQVGIIEEGQIRAFYRKAAGSVECCFEDNGIGMDEMELEKAIHPFRSTKGFGKGLGLGLSMSYRWIERWNGSLSLESTSGKGTRVRFSLPLIERADFTH